jgi:hypothetical protein
LFFFFFFFFFASAVAIRPSEASAPAAKPPRPRRENRKFTLCVNRSNCLPSTAKLLLQYASRANLTGGVDAYACDFVCAQRRLTGEKHPRAGQHQTLWKDTFSRSGLLLPRSLASSMQRALTYWNDPDFAGGSTRHNDLHAAGTPLEPATGRVVEPFVPLLLFNCTTARPQCGGTHTRLHGENYVVFPSASDIRNAALRPVPDDVFARPNKRGHELGSVPDLRRMRDP